MSKKHLAAFLQGIAIGMLAGFGLNAASDGVVVYGYAAMILLVLLGAYWVEKR
jgi:hypothetical protein